MNSHRGKAGRSRTLGQRWDSVTSSRSIEQERPLLSFTSSLCHNNTSDMKKRWMDHVLRRCTVQSGICASHTSLFLSSPLLTTLHCFRSRLKNLKMTFEEFHIPTIIICSIFGPLTCFAVILRVIAKRKIKASLEAEDILAFVSLACYLVGVGLNFASKISTLRSKRITANHLDLVVEIEATHDFNFPTIPLPVIKFTLIVCCPEILFVG